MEEQEIPKSNVLHMDSNAQNLPHPEKSMEGYIFVADATCVIMQKKTRHTYFFTVSMPIYGESLEGCWE